MLSIQMITKYLNTCDLKETIPVLRRTRSTRKSFEEHKIELINIHTKDEISVAIYHFNGKEYKIEIKLDENIIGVSCSDCNEINCLHRRTLLSCIEKNLKAADSDHLSATNSKKRKLMNARDEAENDSRIINSTVIMKEEIKIVKKKKVLEQPSQDLLDIVGVLKMESLMKSFGQGSFKEFYEHCTKSVDNNKNLEQIVDNLTVEQADTQIWHELRIGRITASRLHEATRCTMIRGSFVDKVMGKSSGWSFAMMRGTVLEEFVFEEVKKEFPDLQRSGLLINRKVNPLFAASPDGMHPNFVLEIKCPGTKNTYEQYVDINKLSKKYVAQIQLQMHITGRTKALLAVASLDFETTRNITKIWITLDEDYINDMIKEATEFYEKAIFPALKRKFLR